MYTFTKLHDRRIPKVRDGVGVGPMELKLSSHLQLYTTPSSVDWASRERPGAIMSSAVDIENLLHERLDADRVDFEQDE